MYNWDNCLRSNPNLAESRTHTQQRTLGPWERKKFLGCWPMMMGPPGVFGAHAKRRPQKRKRERGINGGVYTGTFLGCVGKRREPRVSYVLDRLGRKWDRGLLSGVNFDLLRGSHLYLTIGLGDTHQRHTKFSLDSKHVSSNTTLILYFLNKKLNRPICRCGYVFEFGKFLVSSWAGDFPSSSQPATV